MKGFYSKHEFRNGVITSVQRVEKDEINIRIQGEGEQMLTDVVMGEYEALCLAHSILSVVTHKMVEEITHE